jgi:hypothetical protein
MPELIKCRGDENKYKLKELYYLTPLTHLKLLNNQERTCCCGDTINGKNNDSEYYIFSCKSKNKTNPEEFNFDAGMTCANKLIEIFNLNTLPLYNPLSTENDENNYNNSIENNKNFKNSTHKVVWDPLNKELYRAVNILILAWNIKDIKKYKIIEDILSFISNHPNIKTKDWTIKAINNLIGKDKKERTTSQMLKDLSVNAKNIKFPELTKKINEIITTEDNLKNNFI